MSAIDSKAFPEMGALLWGRDREINTIRSKQAVDPTSEQVALFWQELAKRVDQDHDLSNVQTMASELRSDIDLLRGMRDRLVGRREPESQIQLQLVIRLLQFLLEAQGAVARRLRVLRERAYQYYLLYNPAMSHKLDEKIKNDQQKQDDKTTDADVLKVLNDQKHAQKAPVKADTKAEKREKKMAP